jgi:succinate dehydrogenase / fumarate reductase cytochrome b subunit
MWYAWTAKPNAHMTDGSTPALPYYKRNHAYSWERITAWLLIVGIVTHVVHMRFIAYPTSVEQGEKQSYLVRVKIDADLPLVVDKLHAKLYDQKALLEKKEALRAKEALLSKQEKTEGPEYYAKLEDQVLSEKSWLNAASRKPLKKGELLVAAPNPGGALYLVLRETFKKPPLVILYSLFVITAAYHAFNGVWTFMITWGITLTRLSQKRMRAITNILMGIVIFLGLMAAWGTCWPFHFQG